MTRTLKPGPRPFIAFSAMLAVLLLGLIVLAAKGMWWDAGKMAACGLLFYGFLCASVVFKRIIVSTDAVVFRPGLWGEKKVLFKDIEVSLPVALMEPRHPVSIHLFADSGRRTAEGRMDLDLLMEMPLKVFRQADVEWLLAQPGLKVWDGEDGRYGF